MRSVLGRNTTFVVAAILLGAFGAAMAAPVAPAVPTSGWLLDEGAGLALYEYMGTRTGQLGGPSGPPTFSTDTPFAYPGNYSLQSVGTGTNTPSNWAELQGHTSATKGTVAFWVKDEDGGNPRYVLDGSDGSRTLMYRAGSNLGTYINQTGIGNLNGNLIPGPGAGSPWTHVAITWDSSLATDRQKIYKDGVLFDTRNAGIGARNPASVYLGSRFTKNEGWGGKLDEYALWNSPLSPENIEWLASNSIGSIPTAVPGVPIASYAFDEGAGQTAASLFGGGDGVLYSSVGWTANTPHQTDGDHAVWFDGSSASNRVELPGVTFGSEGSIALWAYREGGAQYLFDASPGGRSLLYGHYDLFLNNSHLGGVDGEFIPDNEWTHLAFTWDNALASNGVKLYKNGDLFTTFNATLSTVSPATLWLGNRYSNNEPWRGGIDDYAVWDYALDRDEVGWLYQNPLGSIPEPGTLSLLALGGLAALRRRRKR